MLNETKEIKKEELTPKQIKSLKFQKIALIVLCACAALILISKVL
jgi:hypothetical protein